MSPRQPHRDYLDFETLGHACSRVLEHLFHLLPDGKLQGHEFVARNPTRHDHVAGSFSYNIRKHTWADFATGDKGRGIIALYAYIKKLSYRDAAKEIRRLSGEGNSLPYAVRNYGLSANTDAKPPNPTNLEKDQKLQNYIRRIWQQSQPTAGTEVASYLKNRGLIGNIPPTLRYTPCLWHSETHVSYPAMIAAVTVWPSRKIVALHRTFLNADGTAKADIRPNKKMLGRVSGGAVRFDAPTHQLAVAEGLETALSVRQATGLPTWSALSTSGLVNLVLPELPLAAEIVIGADNDPAGLKAAKVAADKWTSEGRKVRIALPNQGQDFNDLLRQS